MAMLFVSKIDVDGMLVPQSGLTSLADTCKGVDPFVLSLVSPQYPLPKEETFLNHPWLSSVLAGSIIQPWSRCAAGSSGGHAVPPPMQALPNSHSPT